MRTTLDIDEDAASLATEEILQKKAVLPDLRMEFHQSPSAVRHRAVGVGRNG